MAYLSWLHLSDLRVGAESSRLFEPELREELERDLRSLHAESGPWDALILTGDLADTGSRHELETVDLFLDSLLRNLAELGSHPAVLAVPGGHDGKQLYSGELSFEAFTAWYKRRKPASLPTPVDGDFVFTLEQAPEKLRVVGLSSAKRITVEGECALGINLQQARSFLSRDGSPCLVLMHHSMGRLRDAERSELYQLLEGRPVLHLCGRTRRHAPGARAGRRVPQVQGSSLFGRPPFGYSAGRADFDGRRFQIWPRAFAAGAGGRLIGGADRALAPLHPDGSLSFSWPEPAPLPKKMALPAAPGAPPPAPAALPPPGPSPPATLESSPALPAGLELTRTLGAGLEPAVWPAWSPDGSQLATGHADGSVCVWDEDKAAPRWIVPAGSRSILDVAWSPDGDQIAAISEEALSIRDMPDGESPSARGDTLRAGYGLAFHPRQGWLAFRGLDEHVRIRKPIDGSPHPVLEGRVTAVTWSREGRFLVVASARDNHIELWAHDRSSPTFRLNGRGGAVLDLAWMKSRDILAAGYADGSVAVWDLDLSDDTPKTPKLTLAAHSDAVTSVSFSHDGRLLATKSHDGTVKLWRTDTWDNIASIPEEADRRSYGGLCFSPTGPRLATLGSWNLRIWDLDIDALLRADAPRTVHSVSAKIVLVGEGSAGKSCLALRLAEDRYEELGSTHGMRFCPLPAARLDPAARGPAGEEREAVLWDLGGQSEYRLIHQLFLGDTTVALLVMEPRRGKAALDEIEGWLLRLQKLHAERPIKKILVGTKLDDAGAPEDRAAIERFVREHGLDGYVATSARAGSGIDDLRRAIASAIDWEELGKTSQLELFHRIRREIEAQIAARRVVLPLSELDQILRARDPGGHDPEAVRAVVRHLARQGVLVDTRLADGTRALVLQIEHLTRYAGSLILLARENPRGIAAVDLAAVMSPSVKFPRLGKEDRLRRDQELVILDCVVELLLESSAALRHEGLLVFPSLFQATEHDAAFDHTIALYYELSGAVDSIYASLVTALAMSRQFGAIRLWEDRAELRRAGEGTTGVRRVQRGGQGARGIARIELYFDEAASEPTRELFVAVVEEHLREHGVELLESLTMTCACGAELPERAVRARLDKGSTDIGCSVCDTRYPLTFGASEARERSPDLQLRLRALKTSIATAKLRSVSETKVSLGRIQRAQAASAPEPPIRILHLSDLHVSAGDDPAALLQPLIADLEDRSEGLGLDELDMLVVSGDITNRATPAEFEKARELCSGIIARFGLTSERCVLVPGNHDLDWNEVVYRTSKSRAADPRELVPGRYVTQGKLYEIRDEALYPNRFRGFSRDFHHPLLQRPYPLPPEQQGASILCAELGLQFLALNSAWEIDEYFPGRSGIHPGALSRLLVSADQEVTRARDEGRMSREAPLLRIAVWHHPVTGNEKIEDDAFLGSLQKAGVRLCLHGHVHEDRADHVGYLHPTRSVHVAGAGSFGAPAHERPASVPRLYNVVEVERDLSRVRVHTRCLRKPTGAWEGWAVWPGARRDERRTYYEIALGA